MRFSRRDFLQAATVAGAGCAAGFLGLKAALGWGEITDSTVQGSLPANGFKILEVFLYGGVSPWETFYVRSGITDSFFGMGTQVSGLDWANACMGTPVPSNQINAFGDDGLGAVAWGPSTKPLWRTDIFDRARMVVLQHNLEPHEAAIPYALTGHVLGRPNFSGLGSAVSHRFANSSHPLPYSYVFMPDDNAAVNDNFQGMTATGTHGGEHRPLMLMMGPTIGTLATQLARNGMSANADSALRFYRASYADKLRRNGNVSRSKGFSAYDSGLENLLRAPDLATLVGGAIQPPANTTSCTSFLPNAPSSALDRTRASIRAAAALLAQPETSGGARYVGIVDGGLLQAGGAGYDTHSLNDHSVVTATNVFNLCSVLADVIDPAATPAAGKISLSDTLVILKTEFGRTPEPVGSGDSAGRDHWPHGYVNILIGGPIPTSTTRQIAGAIGVNGVERGFALPSTSTDFGHFTPSEFQAALMLAAGIYPFQAENFGVGDMSVATQGSTEATTAAQIRARVLGV